MPYLVSSQIAAGTLDSIRSSVQAASTSINALKINLTDEQKKGARTMASGREGYARMISQIANNNLNSLPREHNPADLVSRLAYDSKLEESRQAIMTLLETITETQMANSIDIMKLADDYAAVLQVSRNNSSALDMAMHEVDEWNARFAHNGNSNNTGNANSPS
jgi:hypothetical protein